jgi:excisionase family DNA binding protein
MDSEETRAELITVKQAAVRLGVSPRTVWRMIADGQLKAVHVRGCTRVYRRSVDDYLKQSELVVCV